ncbi:hypothetical protein MPSYJ_46240 [Mycolicibacterium psychrotolerans]|uniref:Uncharacterized protein n=1 Tax=Mycolicibacterium psychrotolerans TaxID=216929 RepID=A0A7I7MI10_9MYCO|nr:hypothetical protein MPSYJ_46240 [Mycolicibacterium psychrotolerans]
MPAATSSTVCDHDTGLIVPTGDRIGSDAPSDAEPRQAGALAGLDVRGDQTRGGFTVPVVRAVG